MKKETKEYSSRLPYLIPAYEYAKKHNPKIAKELYKEINKLTKSNK